MDPDRDSLEMLDLDPHPDPDSINPDPINPDPQHRNKIRVTILIHLWWARPTYGTNMANMIPYRT